MQGESNADENTSALETEQQTIPANADAIADDERNAKCTRSTDVEKETAEANEKEVNVVGNEANQDEVAPASAAKLTEKQGTAPEKSQPVLVAGTAKYKLKAIAFYDHKTDTLRNTKIILQNQNGPCPLLALCNILSLRGEINTSRWLDEVSFDMLVECLGDYLLRHSPESTSPTTYTQEKSHEAHQSLADYQANLDSILHIIPKLQHGLDVNVKFGRYDSFELTPELLLFDAFHIKLVHGWIVDPTSSEFDIIVKQCGSYNSAVEKMIALSENTAQTDTKGKGKARETESPTGSSTNVAASLTIQHFLESTASQMTTFGLNVLHDSLRPGELCAFFRNNHFSVIHKHFQTGSLYTLVTDQGFLEFENVIWETLTGISGNERFVSGLFEELSDENLTGLLADSPVGPHTSSNPLLPSSSLGYPGSSSTWAKVDLPPPQIQKSSTISTSFQQPQQQAETLTTEENLDRDFAIALKLQAEEELNHVRYLEEENRRRLEAQRLPKQKQNPPVQTQSQPNSPTVSTPSKQRQKSSSSSHKSKKKSDCLLM